MRRVLDDLDRQLIRLLQADARLSTSEIGRKMDVARSTVHEADRTPQARGCD